MPDEQKNFIHNYVEYAATMPEVPMLYNRWAGVMAVAVTLAKNFWMTRGHFNVYPNLYVMLIGNPGTGKGVTCSILQSILQQLDYRAFAADRSSKEKFMQDLADGFDFRTSNPDDKEDGWESLNFDEGPRKAECFILAEEFNDFIGTNNLEFVALLTKLWSYNGVYSNRLKTGRSVNISDPCINLFGGNTHAGFSMAFPPEVIGQGFIARLLLVYGENTGKKVSFPLAPPQEYRDKLVKQLQEIKYGVAGEAIIAEKTRILLDDINQTWHGFPDDLRFQHYGSRRFTQLLKLCLCFAAGRGSPEITEFDVREANTLLTDTEDVMQKALGEFGKARNADVNSKIMSALYDALKPIETNELWKLVANDLNSITELGTVLQNLQHADKIFYSKNPKGWLAKMTERKRNERHVVETRSSGKTGTKG